MGSCPDTLQGLHQTLQGICFSDMEWSGPGTARTLLERQLNQRNCFAYLNRRCTGGHLLTGTKEESCDALHLPSPILPAMHPSDSQELCLLEDLAYEYSSNLFICHVMMYVGCGHPNAVSVRSLVQHPAPSFIINPKDKQDMELTSSFCFS